MNQRSKSLGEPVPGCLVELQNDPCHRGRLCRNGVSVEWFSSPDHILVETVNPKELTRTIPSRNTTCYVLDSVEDTWRMGQIIDVARIDQDLVVYLVGFRGRVAEEIREDLLYLRSGPLPTDPVSRMLRRLFDSPRVHQHRSRFLSSIAQQRAAARGMTGYVSSQIDLLRHQAEVVRRVLEDPLQRYLLADEVGLGKTIEAGAIIRQLKLDFPAAKVLVLVPQTLLGQWEGELRDKFRLPTDDETVAIRGYEALERSDPDDAFDLVVIDEAHHVAHAAGTDGSQIYDTCRALCHSSARVLLLSATPALHHEQDFLAMLHLLDPETYRLEELGTFRELVQSRQPVGNLLLFLQPGISRFSLKNAIGKMRELFVSDYRLSELVVQLQGCVDALAYEQSQVDQLVLAARAYICETWRIYRRMLRSSRQQVAEELGLSRANPTGRLVMEYDEDSRSGVLHGLIEEWRSAAVAAIQQNGNQPRMEAALIDTYVALVECGGTWLGVMEWAIECRLAGWKDTARWTPLLGSGPVMALTSSPLFEAEPEILASIQSAISEIPEDGDRIDQLGQVLAHFHGKGKTRSVVFCSHSAVVSEILARVASMVEEGSVLGFSAGDAPEAVRQELLTFRSQSGPLTLITDQVGEEGLNLEFAHQAIHFDVPWDPNRIEQRMGRLDRIGRKRDLSQRVFAGPDTEPSVYEAWLQVLQVGLGVFSESIADLQFFVDQVVPELKRAAFREGPAGLYARADAVRRRRDRERLEIREQQALDEIDVLEPGTAFFQHLCVEDSRHEAAQAAAEEWMLDVLHLRADEPGSQPGRHSRMMLRGKDVVHYEADEHSHLTPEWARTLNALQPGKATFSRVKAVRAPTHQFFRVGDPFLNAVYRQALQDERGQAYAFWRCVREFGSRSDRLYFRFDYLVGTDATAATERALAAGVSPPVLRAVLRRLDDWLPPQYVSVFVDQRGSVVRHQQLIEWLQVPFQPAENGGYDYSLEDQPELLDQLIAADRWPGFCREARVSADNFLTQDAAWNGQRGLAIQKLTAERQRIEMMLQQRGRGEGAGRGRGEDRWREPLRAQRTALEIAAAALEQTRILLDSCGLIVISSRQSFETGGSEGGGL